MSNTFNCPTCKIELTEGSNSFFCSNGHGHLLTASSLTQVKSKKFKKLKDVEKSDFQAARHCPSCSHTMEKVNYNNTGIIIDSCAKCHHRWLDSSEIEGIKNYSPKMSAEDLLFIENIERSRNNESLLPATGFLGYAKYLQLLPFARRLGLNPTSLMGASGIMAVIKILLYSKFGIVLLLTVAVAFGAIYWYVFKELA